MKIFTIIVISWLFFAGCEPSLSKGKVVSKEYIAEHYDYRIKGASTHYPEKFVDYEKLDEFNKEKDRSWGRKYLDVIEKNGSVKKTEDGKKIWSKI